MVPKIGQVSGPFTLSSLTGPIPRPNLRFEWRGILPPPGQSWRFSLETLEQLDAENRIHLTGKTRMPRLKVFLSENRGVDAGSIWTDIPRLSAASKENVKYPSQKPLGLIDRLLRKGSNEGDIVLDPFCGSGTTIVAAERENRHWIGCDVSEEAITVTASRLNREFGLKRAANFQQGDAETLLHFALKPQRFKPVAVAIDDLIPVGHLEFVLNHEVPIEETRHYEFKEVKTIAGAVDSIVNTADEYAVAFLNSEGGRIYWGIRDKDRVVLGVHLDYQDRDRLRRDVSAKLSQIEPKIDPSKYRIEIHQVRDECGIDVADRFVIEIVVPAPDSPDPYYTGGGDAWVKVDGIKQKLKGIALTDFIKHRLGRAPAS